MAAKFLTPRTARKSVLRVCSAALISSGVLALIGAVLAYPVYSMLRHHEELPEIDLNEYWGPGGDPNGTIIEDTSIRPFRIVFSETLQDQMRTFFEMYRRNNKIPSFNDSAWTYGVNSDSFAEFFNEWIFEYKFRERAKFLNKFDHFKTKIQGLDIHFMHVKPNVGNKENIKVYPLLLLHGWPGSIREFYEAIPRLTNVRAGYDFVFEVIVPSLPGFIYSQGASRPGMNTMKMAVVIRNLMQRLGHTKYYVQGGDFGHTVGSHIATIFPKEVLGFHTNFPANFSKFAWFVYFVGSLFPERIAGQYANRMYPLSEKLKFFMEESGYMHLQGTKPDTIGIALQDSPVGLASYILDRFMVFTNPENKYQHYGGLTKNYSMEKLVDNIMLYWASKSITSSMRLYKESFHNKFEQTLANIPTAVPTWALQFKHELIYQPEFMLRWKYTNLVGSSTLESGGHFAAFERPKTFADDVFRAVTAFVKFKQL